jgi:hypothetical protein
VRNFTGTLCDVGFTDCFESVYSLRVLLPDLHDLTKATLSYYFEQVEGFNCQRFVADGFEVNLEMEGPGSGSGVIPLIRCMLLRSEREEG